MIRKRSAVARVALALLVGSSPLAGCAKSETEAESITRRSREAHAETLKGLEAVARAERKAAAAGVEAAAADRALAAATAKREAIAAGSDDAATEKLTESDLNSLTSPFLSELIDDPGHADGDSTASALIVAASHASAACQQAVGSLADAVGTTALGPEKQRARILDRYPAAVVACR